MNLNLESMASQLNFFVTFAMFIDSGLRGAESVAPVHSRQEPIFYSQYLKKIELANLIETSVYSV